MIYEKKSINPRVVKPIFFNTGYTVGGYHPYEDEN